MVSKRLCFLSFSRVFFLFPQPQAHLHPHPHPSSTSFPHLKKLTSKLRNLCPLPQIPHSHTSILPRRANHRSPRVKHPQRRHVAVLRPEPRHRPRPQSSRVEERQRLVRGHRGEPRGRSVGFKHVDVFWAGEVVLVDVGECVHCF